MLSPRTRVRILNTLLVAGLVLSASAAQAEVRRTASGRPDLTGTYNAATLTPFERPEEYGEKLLMTAEEAEKIAADQAAFLDNALRDSDPDREAPPVGGAAVFGFEENRADGEALGAGNVGGYNWFWVDPGNNVFTVDGKFRTSILIDPPNGRMPAMVPEAQQAMMKRFAAFGRGNDGTAWWLEKGKDAPGPYDHIEQRPNAERCILGFTGYAPTLPSLYNNYKTIVQTDDYVMILIEMNHDARVVRMNSEHPASEVKKWLGDSSGWWEGDTLVVETTNFRGDAMGFRGGSENQRVTERFSAQADGEVLYNFTVEDDTVWTAPWTGEYIWRASPEKLYEYACHEGNYAMGNVMRGARLLEKDVLGAGGR